MSEYPEAKVALRVRAWIETEASGGYGIAHDVALRVTAWIETRETNSTNQQQQVALRVRAWIETFHLEQSQ